MFFQRKERRDSNEVRKRKRERKKGKERNIEKG